MPACARLLQVGDAMITLVLPLLVAVVAALAFGGSMRAWAGVRLHWPLLLLVPFPLLLVMYNPPLDTQPWLIGWGPRIWELAQMALVAGLVRNMLDRSGLERLTWLLAATGVALNALVVLFNAGYMPVSPDAPVWVLEKATTGGIDRLHNTVVMSAATPLAWLGDVLIQPSWFPRANAISIGDVLLSGGIALWGFLITSGRNWSLAAAPSKPSAVAIAPEG